MPHPVMPENTTVLPKKTVLAHKETAPEGQSPLLQLLRQVHSDERGAVSIETILIVGAIAIPILIFVIKVGWPRIKDYFNKGMTDLETGAGAATQ